jgi:hypothetical protein
VELYIFRRKPTWEMKKPFRHLRGENNIPDNMLSFAAFPVQI